MMSILEIWHAVLGLKKSEKGGATMKRNGHHGMNAYLKKMRKRSMQRLQWQGADDRECKQWRMQHETLEVSLCTIPAKLWSYPPNKNNPRWRPGRRIFCGMSLGWSAVGTWQVKDEGIEMGDSVVVMISLQTENKLNKFHFWNGFM